MEVIRHDVAFRNSGDPLKPAATGLTFAGQVAIDGRVADADRLGKRRYGYVVGFKVSAQLHCDKRIRLFGSIAQDAIAASPVFRHIGELWAPQNTIYSHPTACAKCASGLA